MSHGSFICQGASKGNYVSTNKLKKRIFCCKCKSCKCCRSTEIKDTLKNLFLIVPAKSPSPSSDSLSTLSSLSQPSPEAPELPAVDVRPEELKTSENKRKLDIVDEQAIVDESKAKKAMSGPQPSTSGLTQRPISKMPDDIPSSSSDEQD